jgi:hypothetical protein
MATITQLNQRTQTQGRMQPIVEVVAMILSDGSVVEVPDSPRQRAAELGDPRMANGTIAGSDWTLWWERRVFE